MELFAIDSHLLLFFLFPFLPSSPSSLSSPAPRTLYGMHIPCFCLRFDLQFLSNRQAWLLLFFSFSLYTETEICGSDERFLVCCWPFASSLSLNERCIPFPLFISCHVG